MSLRLRVVSESPGLPRDRRLREFSGCGGTIGRSSDNDWVLPDDKRYISSRHAVIDFQAGAYYLVDTSRNGVFVNGADTPVGQGHPQRLFEGDRLRIGEYELSVEVTPETDDLPDDGMRDSIVRAQLVPEEESVELMLVPEDKLIQDPTLQRHLTPASDTLNRRKSALPGSRPTASVKNPVDASAPVLLPEGEQRALAQFLAAAGLKPEALAGARTGEVMQTAGKLLRLMTAGLIDMLQDRRQLKQRFQINETGVQPLNNNPLKVAGSAEEALRFLLGRHGEENCLQPEQAVNDGFRDLRQHEQALVKAMLVAVGDYVEYFDPDELKSRFDKGLKRSGLLSGANKLRYWDLYEENYAALTRHDEGKPPQLFSQEFARAYSEELEVVRTARQR